MTIKVKFDRILDEMREDDSGDVQPELEINMSCTSAELVGMPVYVSGDGAVSAASAASINTAKVIGFIGSKASATACTVHIGGTLSGFTGLTPGALYFLSVTTGQITTTAPTGSAQVVTMVCKALTTTTIMITLQGDYYIRD